MLFFFPAATTVHRLGSEKDTESRLTYSKKKKKNTMINPNSDPLTSVGSYSCLNPPNDPNETYFLTGIQLLGQLFYVVLLIETPWGGRAHAIVGGHHLRSIKIHTYIINCKVILCVNCVCTSDVQGC